MPDLLAQLAEALHDGTLDVVDLTQPLGPETPVISLPPPFANSPGVTIDAISRYDADGPAWYWNELRFGEHTGTHFDAPVHWITGRDLPDNTLDTIPKGNLPLVVLYDHGRRLLRDCRLRAGRRLAHGIFVPWTGPPGKSPTPGRWTRSLPSSRALVPARPPL
jgi:hypothetical protein